MILWFRDMVNEALRAFADIEKVSKKARVAVHRVLVPTLMHGSEN